MCEVSEELKLCSCGTVDPEKLQHYWVLYRYTGPSDMQILGEAMLPNYPEALTNIRNRELLLALLNGPTTVFDTDLQPGERDLLKICFNHQEEDDWFTYLFEFRKGRWKEKPYDPFILENEYRTRTRGKVDPAFRNNA